LIIKYVEKFTWDTNK